MENETRMLCRNLKNHSPLLIRTISEPVDFFYFCFIRIVEHVRGN